MSLVAVAERTYRSLRTHQCVYVKRLYVQYTRHICMWVLDVTVAVSTDVVAWYRHKWLLACGVYAAHRLAHTP